MSRILIVEDDASVRTAMRQLLERHAHQVSEAGSAAAALALDPQRFDLVISDQHLPGESGTLLIDAAAPVPVLIVTSHASVRSAVDALKRGAVDYLPRPFVNDELLDAVTQTLHSHAPVTEPASTIPQQQMIGDCPGMQVVYNRIHRAAPVDVTVLIQGESGTGKELVARAIHHQSQRADAPLICINCAAIPENLIESELFGHEKGAFTGASAARIGLVEAAHGGTLFLDEIGELPLDAQARLLRVLQEGEIRKIGSIETRHVDVRLIAATHRDLHALSRTGEFRLDLYYRLNVMQIYLPPLREREGDVLRIADMLLKRACRRHSREGLKLSRTARREIRDYPWPGNVRELENALERGVILAEGRLIHPDDLGLSSLPSASPRPTTPGSGKTASSPLPERAPQVSEEDLSLEDYFQHFVLEHQDQMSETELAQRLGISRKCLWERRQRLGIPRKKSLRRRSG